MPDLKHDRVRAFLARQNLDALVIARQDNFSWLTDGGDNSVVSSSEIGAAIAVVTAERKWLVAYTMDGCRVMEEQVAGQGFEPVIVRWHEGPLTRVVARLVQGMRLGADFALQGARVFDRELVDLHYPLTDLELDRCRRVGAESSRILAKVAVELRPGMTEREVAARLMYECMAAGMTVDVLILGTDARIERYRHPTPTDKPLERYALIHTAARRWGLHANVTRLVHLGPLPAHIRAAIDAVQRIGAGVAEMLRPGLPFASILQRQKNLYRETGFPEEWHGHFQGGITGYTLADPGRCLDPHACAVSRQAYDYFVTVPGAKFEELTLLTEAGMEIASADGAWPSRRVNGMEVPDVMVL